MPKYVHAWRCTEVGVERYRARVWARRETASLTWFVEVYNVQSGEIVHTDNTGSLKKMHDQGAWMAFIAHEAWTSGWLPKRKVSGPNSVV